MLGLLAALRRFLTGLARRRARRGYHWLIEVRPVLEKHMLRNVARDVTGKLGVPGRFLVRVTHVTLVYNFRPRVEPLELIRVVARVAAGYDRIPFLYDGIVLARRRHGKGYVLAFNVRPSRELIEFREELYRALQPLIEEDPEAHELNSQPVPWFHASIALGAFPEEVLARYERLRPDFLLPSEVWRVTLLRRGRIAYEYDHMLRRILRRREALSRSVYAADVRAYRRTRGLETAAARATRSARRPARVWVVADLHLGHRNIIRYTARPFASVEEMDRILIHNWNSVVSPNDTVYVVGDLTLNRRKARSYLRVLHGGKIIIRGNHDGDYACCDSLTIEYHSVRFLLSHRPVEPPPGYWVIHGHKHNRDLRRYPFINPEARTINVSVELTRYKPVSLDTIVGLIKYGRTFIELPAQLDPVLAAAAGQPRIRQR